MPPAALPVRHRSLAIACKAHPPTRHHLSRTTSRPFSSSQHALKTLQRQRLWTWLRGPGEKFRNPLPGSTNYLNAYDSHGQLKRAPKRNEDEEMEEDEENTDTPVEIPLPKERPEDLRPFPANVYFRSQAVLSDALRQRVFEDVTQNGFTVREASEKHNVDINRVGAVVRLKTIEEQWIKQGKPLALPYARAVLAMVPQTPPGDVHESINDLPVHAATTTQLFWPASESRQFTRRDAGEAFMTGLLPAEERIPHPQMVRARQYDGSLPANREVREAALKQQMRERDRAEERRRRNPERQRAANTTLVHATRADFRFENVAVTRDSVGPYTPGIGTRYGVPAQDRKKGQLKIPRRVE